ncbi:Polymerase/histidinol phosphatase-like protein [Hygrophoropsis aurantiaca]|uniref:Polymerase/histidinol phosphatase-like protein n=1 Tax=Hygrophoropsis aurantiaca TaxID=72124 RepID=A0ACB8ASH7_9AGAM|nr:Polymerase/histidinol phosphatase-like protein [Hygrophoropsis aurantiaca]
MPHSHHSHSGQFCKHASGTSLEAVVQAAIQRGFEVYGLTEHVPRYRVDDLYPEEEGMSLADLLAQFQSFLTEAHRLKVAYASRITLLVGLETEYITAIDLDMLEALLEDHRGRIEYIVGSVHHVNEIPIDFDRLTFEKALHTTTNGDGPQVSAVQMDRFLSAYFDAQRKLLERFQPEIIGHLDLCRLYNPTLKFRNYPEAWKKLEENIQCAIKYGALFEVNAAALRKGWESAYPGPDILPLILQNRGRLALSDDSHGPQAVGNHYPQMAAYLRHMGVEELWYLIPSDVQNTAGRYLTAARIPGNWWEHPFWKESSLPDQC